MAAKNRKRKSIHPHVWGKVVQERKHEVRRECNAAHCRAVSPWEKKRSVPVIVPPSMNELLAMTLAQLRAMAADRAIRGRWSMNRHELIEALTEVKVG